MIERNAVRASDIVTKRQRSPYAKNYPAEQVHAAGEGKRGARPEENCDHQRPETSLVLRGNKARSHENQQGQQIGLAKQIRTMYGQVEQEGYGSCREERENLD